MASLGKFLPSRWRSNNVDQPPSAEPAYQSDTGSESGLKENRDSAEKDSLKAIDETAGVVIKEADNVSPGALTLEEGSYRAHARLT